MNNIIIGVDSGQDLTTQEGYFILGDNISFKKVDDRTATETIFFDVNKKIAIKKDMLSEKALKYLKLR